MPFDTRRGEQSMRPPRTKGNPCISKPGCSRFCPRSSCFCTVVYAFLTSLFCHRRDRVGRRHCDGDDHRLTLIIATFFRFVARRLDTRPEDYEGAEISRRRGGIGLLRPTAGGRS